MAQLFFWEDNTVMPQDQFDFTKKSVLYGLDSDGETIRQFVLAEELKNTYFVLFFFPMDFKVDSSEVLAFNEKLDEFKKRNIKVIGVTHDSPYVIKHWTRKDSAKGGFGKAAGFPILSDKDLKLAHMMGVAQPSGMPARSTFIIDWNGAIRYMMIHRSDIGRSVVEILRLSIAFRHSDMTGEITPAKWMEGDEVIPTEFNQKVAYFKKKYGKSSQTETAKTESADTKNTKNGKENGDKNTGDKSRKSETPSSKNSSDSKSQKSSRKAKSPTPA